MGNRGGEILYVELEDPKAKAIGSGHKIDLKLLIKLTYSPLSNQNTLRNGGQMALLVNG